MENGTLYIVATPIGNLADISLRAIEILQTVSVIACEDTRKTGFLLNHLNKNVILANEAKSDLAKLRPESDPGQVADARRSARMTHGGVRKKPFLLSYHEHNEQLRIPQIIAQLKSGTSVALVSDAGMPVVSDPGYRLVDACIKEEIAMQVIPGASSVLTALVLSGLPPDKFFFLGYLPHKPGKRKSILEKIRAVSLEISQTIIVFEAPHKLLRTLSEMQEVLGDIPIVLCRELTKLHEEVRRETISSAIQHFQKTAPKGEFVILFHLNTDS
jgi:16S rRNA (cytidine1402-2'-O)-methyltransferase